MQPTNNLRNPMGVFLIGSLGFGLLMAMRAEAESLFTRALLAGVAFVVFGLTYRSFLKARVHRKNSV